MFLWSELTNELAEAHSDSSGGPWRARLWMVLVHVDNPSSQALECSFTYKKTPLKFLLSNTGFTGTPNPIAVQWQRERFVGENSSEWHSPCQVLLSSQVKVGKLEIQAWFLTVAALSPALLFLGSNRGWGESWHSEPPKWLLEINMANEEPNSSLTPKLGTGFMEVTLQNTRITSTVKRSLTAAPGSWRKAKCSTNSQKRCANPTETEWKGCRDVYGFRFGYKLHKEMYSLILLHSNF